MATISCFCHCRLDAAREKSTESPSVAQALICVKSPISFPPPSLSSAYTRHLQKKKQIFSRHFCNNEDVDVSCFSRYKSDVFPVPIAFRDFDRRSVTRDPCCDSTPTAPFVRCKLLGSEHTPGAGKRCVTNLTHASRIDVTAHCLHS